ncbi:SRPBCC domain-containing protein [Saccharopolyspora sp. K220]|uniref:SRPBCC domain-containing protein n=1 Tax=Saccharopolyspora soli TaxID=2926618 RepID=UPI001F57616A|nr:SRPBCC domain-containing protein [Saccharopolyspora soli]MCI2424222.1 SRPBCC domain-containing protein [Saccharopolyspora soli]
MLGKLRPLEDGRCELRFERGLAHAQEKVWRAITDPAQLRAWFVEILDYDRCRLDFAEGTELTFVPKPEHDLPTGQGRTTRIDPPRLLEYTWDAEVLRWELEADGPDACRLIFTNIVADRELAIAVASGWHAGLDQLAAFLDGRPVEQVDLAGLQAEYQDVLG